ncbi:hypothetical protein [Neptunicella marina]|uniref:Uncharacterized protein n=1 Tax=Neptunicella marina TaxID=2125989 RepID=A0A8J6M0T4_9ALTE|nr:hypothetical protein [Neptunicella marina]MBC3765022.1 hypothetical protein [Neptunicella marina]
MIELHQDIFDTLLAIKLQGYQFCSFENNAHNTVATPRIFLRHDIDFDLQVALAFARREAELGISATYYFLMRSDAYNFFSADNLKVIQQIQALGHAISLHFDVLCYTTPETGLQQELKCFTDWTGVTPKVVSIHRPPKYFFGEQNSSLAYPHTYQAQYVKQIQYLSDSGGSFKYGHPLHSEAFNTKQDLHLLIHPIWSVAEDAMQCLAWLKLKKHQDFHQLLRSNCIPYRNHTDDSEQFE